MTRRDHLNPACTVCCMAVLLLLGSTAVAQSARDMLEATGIQGGLVVHLGCGDGKLTAALRAGDKYLYRGRFEMSGAKRPFAPEKQGGSWTKENAPGIVHGLDTESQSVSWKPQRVTRSDNTNTQRTR